MANRTPVTVVETPEFISRAKKLLTDEDREELIGYLAYNPTAGDVVSGAGGVRKILGGTFRGEAREAEQESSTSFTAPAFRCSSSQRLRRTSA